MAQLETAEKKLTDRSPGSSNLSSLLKSQFVSLARNPGEPTRFESFQGFLATCILKRADEEQHVLDKQLIELHRWYCSESERLIVSSEEQIHWFEKLRSVHMARKFQAQAAKCQDVIKL